MKTIKINPLLVAKLFLVGVIGVSSIIIWSVLDIPNQSQSKTKFLSLPKYLDISNNDGVAQAINSSSLSPNPKPLNKTTVDSDPIVNCGPGQTSKQYVKDKQSNCKNYVDCGLNGNTVWIMMLNSDCNKKHQLENTHPVNNKYYDTKNSAVFQVLCTTSLGTTIVLGYSEREAYDSCEKLKAIKDNSGLNQYTPLPASPPLQATSQQPSQDAINACRARFAALGTLDSSYADQCYTNPSAVNNLPNPTCYNSYDEYFKTLKPYETPNYTQIGGQYCVK